MGSKKPRKEQQIRVYVDKIQLDTLKTKARELKMSVEHYSGLILSGYTISRKE